MSLTNGNHTVMIAIVAPLIARVFDTRLNETQEMPLVTALECVDRLLASGYTVAG